MYLSILVRCENEGRKGDRNPNRIGSSCVKIGSVTDQCGYRFSDVSLVFFGPPTERVREQSSEVPNLNSNISLELGTEVPALGIDLQGSQ